ncbi:amidase family protein [Phyllobacterium zundukense]|uniref:amidase family protein n=1 Tax=Phyllobacterium zundukense TaxID=1867719 RepID=UPI001EEDE138|nr:amidase family protein [Phyllobacterium zundukense]
MTLRNRTIPQLIDAFRSHELSPVDVAIDALARAEEAAEFNAFVFLDHEAALAQARESEKRWMAGAPLSDIDGVPATIKDLHHVAGWKTFAGSATSDADEKQAARQESPLVARLREAGCVFLGKTTVPEFGWKGVTDSPLTGVTRNPWDKTKVSGGSSGGAAVAAALGIGRIHTGSDGGGSIRIPSAFCGVVGLKASFGAVPQFPLVSTMSSHGPMTATVHEAIISLRHAGKRDPRDWLATGSNIFETVSSAELRPLRVGMCLSGIGPEPDDEIRLAVETAARTIAGREGRVIPVQLPVSFEEVRQLIDIFWVRDSAMDWDRTPADRRHRLDPGLVEMAQAGLRLSAVEMAYADYRRAALASAVNVFLDEFDVLLMPATPFVAFDVGQDFPAESGMTNWLDWAANLYLFNLSQSPAMSFPMERSATSGLPIAVQIVAGKYRDAVILDAAMRLEARNPQ